MQFVIDLFDINWQTCGQAFLKGASPTDFAPEDYEVGWVGRGTVDDLNAVGRKQLGLEAW